MQAQRIRLSPDYLEFTYQPGQLAKSILIVENISSSKLWFKINCSLDRQMQIEPKEGNLESGHSAIIEIALQHEPYINYAVERVALTHSPKPFLYGYLTDSSCQKEMLRLEVRNLPGGQDKPQFIRMNESAAFKNTGNQLYKEGKYEAALEKYQQAIAVYKYDIKYYSNQVLTLRKMKRYREALETTEKALLLDDNNAKVLSVKAIIYAEISKNTENQQQKLTILKEAKRLGQQALSLPYRNISTDSIQQIINKIKILESRVGVLSIKDFSKWMIEKAIIPQDKFQGSQFKQIFNKYEHFVEYLKNALSVKESETPEYVLDPLNYVKLIVIKEIYKNPLIVPSGVSYQETVLKDFFKMKGPIDPIVKTPINLNMIFPNNDLANFLNNSERMASWRETQAQLLHANDDIQF